MFRDTLAVEPTSSFWQSPTPTAAAPRKPATVAAFVEDEVGAVAHVYREIASRISRNAFTRHASTLGDALR